MYTITGNTITGPTGNHTDNTSCLYVVAGSGPNSLVPWCLRNPQRGSGYAFVTH